jgi:glycosyltransferase involved in cell wall biosynthesis
MIVGLDARKLDDFGIGTYLAGLIEEFARLGCPETLVAYRRPDRPVPSALAAAPTVRWRAEPAPLYSLRELWRLAWAARRDRVELYHAPHYVCPPVLPCPAVVTIHDLIHLRVPDPDRPCLAPLYARVMLGLAVRRARWLITVSEASRQDLQARLGAPAARIRVIPNGVAAHFRPAADPAALDRALARLGVTRPYFLFVGNPLPHKNLGGLLDAFAPLPSTIGRLVLVGIAAPRREAVVRACAARGIADRVTVLAPRPASDLPRLYQGATALVCPSLWEGFGLPALEAMACGTPVLAAARGGLPEVVGDAGLLVDPTHVDALREGLYNLAVHESLRETLAAAGLARARQFSWQRAAEATLAVYREALPRGLGTHG